MSTLLEIKNIETYYVLIYALRGVSLTVDEGTITAILGNNGAGKSTVLKTVMGLLDDQPDKGTIEFMGKRIDGKDPEVIVRMGISYVPEGREVFNELSVRENLLMGAYTRRDRKNIKKDFARKMAKEKGTPEEKYMVHYEKASVLVDEKIANKEPLNL